MARRAAAGTAAAERLAAVSMRSARRSSTSSAHRRSRAAASSSRAQVRSAASSRGSSPMPVRASSSATSTGRVVETEVDVYSPCAVGGTLDAESIPRLACRAIAGCANNQLAEPGDADRLRERGILYAPDYVVSAGGIIQLIGLEDEGWDEAHLEERLAGIGETLRTLFAEADAESITPAEAADRLVRRRLAEARPS